jgi:hypothetical protein
MPFAGINLNEPGFVVSNTDVLVSTINADTSTVTVWNILPSGDGIWMATRDQNVFQDSTDGNGDCVISFGNSAHGAMPGIGVNILVMYTVTSGTGGNNGGAGATVQYPGDSLITGISATAIAGGSDEKPASFYRQVAPYIRRAGNVAVNYAGYKAIALAFPGVSSVFIQAQRDIAPNDPRWSNVIRICVLPTSSDVFTAFQWASFIQYMQERCHAAVQIQPMNATKLPIDINIRLAILKDVQPSDMKVLVTSKINSLFVKNINSLGHMITLSDISAACKQTGVDYSDILTPVSDLTPLSAQSWYSPSTINLDIFYTDRSFSTPRTGVTK